MNRPQRKARVLAHQTEVFADLDVLMAAVREAVTRLVEAHAAAKRAQAEVVLANEIVSHSELTERESTVAA